MIPSHPEGLLRSDELKGPPDCCLGTMEEIGRRSDGDDEIVDTNSREEVAEIEQYDFLYDPRTGHCCMLLGPRFRCSGEDKQGIEGSWDIAKSIRQTKVQPFNNRRAMKTDSFHQKSTSSSSGDHHCSWKHSVQMENRKFTGHSSV